MTTRIDDKYFKWLHGLVCDVSYTKRLSYKKLLLFLHGTDFRYSITYDRNRAEDGIDLRDRFTFETGIQMPDMDKPCSVLEMLVALSIRCEEHIMDDPDIGDRTGQWFWTMLVNLGLGSLTDENFNKATATKKITVFLNRQYKRNGEGGLFTLDKCSEDLRTVEIWYQMCWYLNSIL